jgi:hypothetical protein
VEEQTVMDDQDLKLDLGMLCRCCDHSYQLPDLKGFTESERISIEEICQLCVESFKLTVVNG